MGRNIYGLTDGIGELRHNEVIQKFSFVINKQALNQGLLFNQNFSARSVIVTNCGG